MDDVLTAQNLMHEAFPVNNGRNVKACIWEAYRKLRLRSERRARAIWNAEAKRIDHHEMEALERALLERAQHEYAKAQCRIASLEASLRMADSDFFSNQIDDFR